MNWWINEPIVYTQVDNAVITINLCDECGTCGNTVCFDIEKLRKHQYEGIII